MKKTLLSFLNLAAIAVPIAAVVACGSDKAGDAPVLSFSKAEAEKMGEAQIRTKTIDFFKAHKGQAVELKEGAMSLKLTVPSNFDGTEDQCSIVMAKAQGNEGDVRLLKEEIKSNTYYKKLIKVFNENKGNKDIKISISFKTIHCSIDSNFDGANSGVDRIISKQKLKGYLRTAYYL